MAATRANSIRQWAIMTVTGSVIGRGFDGAASALVWAIDITAKCGGGALSNNAGTLRVVAELVKMIPGKTRYHCLHRLNHTYFHGFESKHKNSVAERVARPTLMQFKIIIFNGLKNKCAL